MDESYVDISVISSKCPAKLKGSFSVDSGSSFPSDSGITVEGSASRTTSSQGG